MIEINFCLSKDGKYEVDSSPEEIARIRKEFDALAGVLGWRMWMGPPVNDCDECRGSGWVDIERGGSSVPCPEGCKAAP